MPISSQAAAAKPWETTRMWLQRNLSVAAAHMLRDGLWTLARTTGIYRVGLVLIWAGLKL